MQSKATTVEQYLAELPEDRRAAIAAVRQVMLTNLHKDFEEGIHYGMIGYCVPHRIYPAGYHCDPKQALPFAALASQKNYMSLYLGSVYSSAAEAQQFHADWAKTGKKLDMGKSCIRFKQIDDLALNVIAAVLRRTTVKKFIADYESVFKDSRKKLPAKAVKSRTTSNSTRVKK